MKNNTEEMDKNRSYSLEYLDPVDRNFNRVIVDISVVQRETTLTFSDAIETGSPLETEIVRVVPLSITEMTEITLFKKKKKYSGSRYLELMLPRDSE